MNGFMIHDWEGRAGEGVEVSETGELDPSFRWGQYAWSLASHGHCRDGDWNDISRALS
jgi:hypothetical protein